MLCFAKGTSGVALAAARELADRTEGKILPTSAAENEIDADLLDAARRIMYTRTLARCLQIAESRIPRGSDPDGWSAKLEREVEDNEISTEADRKLMERIDNRAVQ